MTVEPRPKPRRKRPLKAGEEPAPTTIAALNAKLDRILDNGTKQFEAVRDLAVGNDVRTRSYRRLLGAVAALGALSFVLGVVAWQASSDAKAAKAQICTATQANRNLLRAVVVTSYGEGGVGDLREIVGYADLDPATRTWVDGLQEAISPELPSTTRDTNDNGVPDAVDRLLDKPVCVASASGSRSGALLILGSVVAAAFGFGMFERRRRRQEQPEGTPTA